MWPWYRGHCCSAANESWHQGRRTWPNCCKGQEWGSPHGRIEGRATGSVCELKVTAVKVIEHSQLLYNIHACKITSTSVAICLPHSTLCSLPVSLFYIPHFLTPTPCILITIVQFTKRQAETFSGKANRTEIRHAMLRQEAAGYEEEAMNYTLIFPIMLSVH